MTTQETISHAGPVSPSHPAEERAALKAVLSSHTFATKPRLASLLEYICERYFEGDVEGIKEYSIATDVFRRPASFDQATDSIVRVEVYRLRKRLRDYYDGEGADQPIEIVVATGHYRPEFIDRAPDHQASPDPAVVGSRFAHNEGSASAEEGLVGNEVHHPAKHAPEQLVSCRPFGSAAFLVPGAMIATVLAGALVIWLFTAVRNGKAKTAQASISVVSPVPSGPEIRIRCGYSRPVFKDEEGNLWMGDRYFSGGSITELPNQHIAGTRTPELYLTARSGVFSYRIPLAPGIYELRLHFAETTYTPASVLGGGENSRIFDVRVNGKVVLSQFDIVSDAGADTADVRIFRDISPAKDGNLQIDVSASLGLPILNAIEIVPGVPHSMRPIRMLAQNSFFTDKAGNLWMPDTYFSSGRLAENKVVVSGTMEPGLFAGERYGNFTYAIPAPDGSYKLTLYFSETYWEISAKGGAGSRLFDVFCNGVALARRLDILTEAGPGRALIKVYHDLRPNAQGKLILSFVPDVNYASVNAVEVEQESP